MLQYLLYFVIILCILHIIFNCNGRAKLYRKIPGPPLVFIFGNMFIVFGKSLVEIMKLTIIYRNTWNGIYRIWALGVGAVVIYNPEDVKIIMSDMKYADKGFIYKFLKPWLGEGLLVSNGTKWQERRKLLTRTFHFNILKQFCEIINENSDRLVNNLNETAGKPVNLQPVLSEFTLHAICETAMGTKLSDNTTTGAKLYKFALKRIAYYTINRLARIYLYPDFIFKLSSWGINQLKYIKMVHRFTESVIQQRKLLGNFEKPINNDSKLDKEEKKVAMLDLLLSAERDGLIDKSGVQEEVDTFMFEGHDTTTSGLTFCLMLLANHRKIQDKIRKELIEIFGNSKRPIKMEDLNKMKYLECCIQESLRMYPPVFLIGRTIHETTVLSNYTIPPGTLCCINILDLHNQESTFKNPELFDPDRFLPENSVGRHPYAYIPFSAGPRNCIGQKYAMMELKIAITKLLLEFYLEPITRPEDICFEADFILSNFDPIKVKFLKRNP